MIRSKTEMKRLLQIFITALALGTISSAAGQPFFAFDQLDPDLRQCSSDAECTVVMLTCCSCTLAAVHISEAAAVQARVRTDSNCPNEVCPISCEGPEVRCVSNLCEIDESYTGNPPAEQGDP